MRNAFVRPRAGRDGMKSEEEKNAEKALRREIRFAQTGSRLRLLFHEMRTKRLNQCESRKDLILTNLSQEKKANIWPIWVFRCSLNGQTNHGTIFIGALIANPVQQQQQEPGNYQYTFEAKDLPDGIYLVVVQTNGERVAKRVVLAR